MKRTVWILLKLLVACTAILGVLFTIYITNADSKLVEFVYDKLTNYHNSKKVEDKI